MVRAQEGARGDGIARRRRIVYLHKWSFLKPNWAKLESKIKAVFPDAKFSYSKKVVKQYKAYKCDRDVTCSPEEANKMSVKTGALSEYSDDFSIEGQQAYLYVSCPVEDKFRGEVRKLIDLLDSLGYRHRTIPVWLLLYGVALVVVFGGIGLLKLLGV